MDPFTNDDFRRISQELLNDDANAHRIIRDAREEIRERYQLLFTKNPEKGKYSRTNALLLLTLLFAEHTVLGNLPLQPQLFPAIRGTI